MELESLHDISTSTGFDIMKTYLKLHENIFERQNFDVQWIHSDLNSNWRLIMILDGYDEMQHQNYNLWETNEWNINFKPTVSTIVFAKNLQITNSKLRENFKFQFELNVIEPEIYEILEFEASKVILLIEKTVKFLKSMHLNNSENCDNPWVMTKTYTQNTDWEKDSVFYLTWVHNILPALSQVAKTPFILIMLVQMLPGIVHENNLNISDCFNDSNDCCKVSNDIIQKICATELAIYTKFVDSWFAFYQRKAKIDSEINSIPGFVEKISYYYKAYATNISTLLLFQNRGFLGEGSLSENDTEKWDLWVPRFEKEQGQQLNASLSEFAQNNDLFSFTDDRLGIKDKHIRNLRKLRNACFIKKNQTLQGDKVIYKFLHTSIIEYFGSREIFGGLRSQLDQVIRNGTNNTNFSFNTHIITDQAFTGVLTFLIQKAREDAEFYNTLQQCVFRSAEVYGIQRLAANAISVMNMAGMPLPTQLKNVQIPGANLANCIAGNVDLSGANLSGSILTQAWAPLANFRGANLNDCVIGHGVPLRVLSDSNYVKSLVILGNKHVVCSYINKSIWIYSMDHNNLEKGGFQIKIPKQKGERQERMIFLHRINDFKVLIVNISVKMFPDVAANTAHFIIANQFVYDASENVLQEIPKERDSVAKIKRISIAFNHASITLEERDGYDNQNGEEESDDYNNREVNVDLKVDAISESKPEFEFQDKFSYIWRLYTYNLHGNGHLLCQESITLIKDAGVPTGANDEDRCEKVTRCEPIIGNNLFVLSSPMCLDIHSNRDFLTCIEDFSYTENPIISLTFYSKKKITIFLIELLSLKVTTFPIQLFNNESASDIISLFSPNGKFFVVHTRNPKIYCRESKTWINVSDNSSDDDFSVILRIDSENRFLAFARSYYIAVCNLRTGIIFQKISRLQVSQADFSFFTDRNRHLCLMYENGSVIQSTQVVENVNRTRVHQQDVPYDIINVSHDGTKLATAFRPENNDPEDFTKLIQVFEVESSTVHTKRDLMFQARIDISGDFAFFNELLFVPVYGGGIEIWKLSKTAKRISSPVYLQSNEIYFLDKIKLLIYVDRETHPIHLRCCEVDEDVAGGLQLNIKVSILVSESVAEKIEFGNCLSYLDMNNPNKLYLSDLKPIAVLDLKSKSIKPVEYRKNKNCVPTSAEICRKFCFDLKLGEIHESSCDTNDPVILQQTNDCVKDNRLYDWSYEEKVIAIALPGRLIRILDMDFQILFQFEGFYEISGVRLLPRVIPNSSSSRIQFKNDENEAGTVLNCDLLIWNKFGLLTRLSDIVLSAKSYETSKWRIVSTQAPSETLCLNKAAINQYRKSTKEYDGVFKYYDCIGNPSTRSYRSYPELFKAVREDDKSIFPLNETETHINLRTHWAIFVVSREMHDLPIPTIDSHVALIIEGMRNERHFVMRAELILNHGNKFEIKMESIDEKSAVSAAQFISCGWERKQDIVLKLIDAIWNDKNKFEEEEHEYHTIYNNCCKYITDKLKNVDIIIATREIFGRKVYLPWDLLSRRNKKIGREHLFGILLWFVFGYCQRFSRDDLKVYAFWVCGFFVALAFYQQNN